MPAEASSPSPPTRRSCGSREAFPSPVPMNITWITKNTVHNQKNSVYAHSLPELALRGVHDLASTLIADPLFGARGARGDTAAVKQTTKPREWTCGSWHHFLFPVYLRIVVCSARIQGCEAHLSSTTTPPREHPRSMGVSLGTTLHPRTQFFTQFHAAATKQINAVQVTHISGVVQHRIREGYPLRRWLRRILDVRDPLGRFLEKRMRWEQGTRVSVGSHP